MRDEEYLELAKLAGLAHTQANARRTRVELSPSIHLDEGAGEAIRGLCSRMGLPLSLTIRCLILAGLRSVSDSRQAAEAFARDADVNNDMPNGRKQHLNRRPAKRRLPRPWRKSLFGDETGPAFQNIFTQGENNDEQ